MSLEVRLAQDRKPHERHVRSTFQAYMRDIGRGTPDEDTVKVTSDAALDRYCGHDRSDTLPGITWHCT